MIIFIYFFIKYYNNYKLKFKVIINITHLFKNDEHFKCVEFINIERYVIRLCTMYEYISYYYSKIKN